MSKGKIFFMIFFSLAILINSYRAYATTVVHTCQELQDMRDDLSGDYVLANDIDCTQTKDWNSGAGFIPVGGSDTAFGFKGNLDGQGHKVKNLFISRPTNVSTGNAGLFYLMVAGTIKNITLENVYAKSSIFNTFTAAGGLVGIVSYDGAHPIVLDNVYVTGNVIGDSAGGLVGKANGVAILNSSVNVIVQGQMHCGGLAGTMIGVIQKSSSSGQVIGARFMGGLVGVGLGSGSTITDSYSNVKVALGNSVNQESVGGGLVGEAYFAGNILNTYAVGNVGIGTAGAGGLIGRNSDTVVIASFWDRNTTGQIHSAGSPDSSGYSTVDFINSIPAFNWDFQNTWLAPTNPASYPVLRWQLEPSASLWNTFNELSRQTELLNAVLPSEQAEQRNAVNWTDLDILNYGVNWLDSMRFSRPLYWNDQPVSVLSVNWNNLEVLSKQGINWESIVDMTNRQINWSNINPVVKNGINWVDWEGLTKSGINWADVSVLSRQGVNWINLSITEKTGINWMDWSVLTNAGVNWRDIATISKSVINWFDVGILNDAINWEGVSALSSKQINWKDLSEFSHPGVNWQDLNEFGNQGINWNDAAFLNSLNLTPEDLRTLRTIGMDTVPDIGVESIYYSLFLSKFGNGSVTSDSGRINCGSSCSAESLQGTVETLHAVPADGYQFEKWLGACTGTGVLCTVMYDKPLFVSAYFVSSVVPLPDLVISALNVYPTTAPAGSTISATTLVKNQGTLASGLSRVSFHLSLDAVYGGTDDVVISINPLVSALNIGVSKTITTSLKVPAGINHGTYYLCGLSDSTSVVTEENEGNNWFCAQSTIQVVHPDLTSTAVSASDTGVLGNTLAVTDTVLNQGGDVLSFNVGLYLSNDQTITTADTRLGNRLVSQLAGGKSSTGVTTLTIPYNLAVGTYYVGAIADYNNARVEADEGNNEVMGNAIVLLSEADLVVNEVSGPSGAARGTSITVQSIVANQGTGVSNAFNLGVYLSADETITTADRRIASRSVASMPAGTTKVVAATATVSNAVAPGTYYIGAIADYTQKAEENNETNNSTAGNVIDIQ